MLTEPLAVCGLSSMLAVAGYDRGSRRSGPTAGRLARSLVSTRQIVSQPAGCQRNPRWVDGYSLTGCWRMGGTRLAPNLEGFAP